MRGGSTPTRSRVGFRTKMACARPVPPTESPWLQPRVDLRRMPERRLKTNRRIFALTVAVTLVTVEGLSYVAQRILVGKGIIYKPPSAEAVHEAYRYPP